jgi:hypothetical protein
LAIFNGVWQDVQTIAGTINSSTILFQLESEVKQTFNCDAVTAEPLYNQKEAF